MSAILQPPRGEGSDAMVVVLDLILLLIRSFCGLLLTCNMGLHKKNLYLAVLSTQQHNTLQLACRLGSQKKKIMESSSAAACASAMQSALPFACKHVLVCLLCYTHVLKLLSCCRAANHDCGFCS